MEQNEKGRNERGSEKETEGNTCREGSCHDDLRRISRAQVAAASSRAAQPQHKPPCRKPLLPPFSDASRCVAFLDLRGTRRGTGGAHYVLKTSRRPRAPSLRRVRAPSEVSPPKTPLPITPYEVPVERWLDASRGRGWDALRTWTLPS